MENSRHALIGEGILPLFGKPSPHQVVIDEGLYGMDCVILEEKDDYALIRMEYGYEGWVLKRGLCEGTWPSYLEKVRVGKRQIDVLAKTEVASEIVFTSRTFPSLTAICSSPLTPRRGVSIAASIPLFPRVSL